MAHYWIYVYGPEDFRQALPDEQGSAAAGAPTFRLRLKADAEPTLVKVQDDDLIFDEVDTSQVTGNEVTIGGVTYAKGTTIHTAYDLYNTDSSGTITNQITSIHFGGDGYQQGAVHGIASTQPLSPNQRLRFSRERTSHQKDNPYSQYAACFVAGTLIETSDGPRPVETLEVGDQIMGYDGALHELRLKPSRSLDWLELLQMPNLAPIRICAGALGQGLPARDLLVSPQHRMLVTSPIVRRMFGVDEVLVAAKKLTVLPGIYVDHDVTHCAYHHLLFDTHEVVIAEGAPSESFYCGEYAIKALTPEAREEMETLFPGLIEGLNTPESRHMIPEGRLQKRLLERHSKNEKPVLAM